ncbi:hypothetical protein G7046_g4787 [Stylonectria norvegica]|nr:hypothetical protein G7046_g4787 [Stylonectria norvegica]
MPEHPKSGIGTVALVPLQAALLRATQSQPVHPQAVQPRAVQPQAIHDQGEHFQPLEPQIAHFARQRFDQIQENYDNALMCGICATPIRGGPSNLQRHVKTHTGSQYTLTDATQPTRSHSAATRMRRQELAKSEHHNPADLELVRRMICSTPCRTRHSGGRFHRGALAGLVCPGLPRYFESTGRLKDRYNWIRDRTPTAVTRLRPRRGCSTYIPPSFANQRWTSAGFNEDRPFTEIETNLWTPSRYSQWLNPDKTRGHVEDPTGIPRELRQCGLCMKLTCNCIVERVRKGPTPVIVPAGAMGDGLKARLRYAAGDLLRELVGELAPLNTIDDGWAAELARDDLTDDGAMASWCLVHTLYCGNWARKANHSCEPNVELSSMKISGRWRVMLQAMQTVEPGEWITVSYGDSYWDDQYGMRCQCGSSRCVSDRQQG